jgi:hypothetical protein
MGQFTPTEANRLMSPYMQAVVDVQKREARRQGDIQRQQIGANAVQGAGAFGGSRQAILEGEQMRNEAQLLDDIQAKGQQSAYESAGSMFEREKGRQLAGGQQLSGLAQLAPNIAATEIGGLAGVGQQKQQQQQSALDIGYQQFQEEQQYPERVLQEYSSLVRGFPLTPNQFSVSQTATPAPNLGTQLAGALGTGAGLYGAFKKVGGKIDDPKGLATVHRASSGSILPGPHLSIPPIKSLTDLLTVYGGNAPELNKWLADNPDSSITLEYLEKVKNSPADLGNLSPKASGDVIPKAVEVDKKEGLASFLSAKPDEYKVGAKQQAYEKALTDSISGRQGRLEQSRKDLESDKYLQLAKLGLGVMAAGGKGTGLMQAVGEAGQPAIEGLAAIRKEERGLEGDMSDYELAVARQLSEREQKQESEQQRRLEKAEERSFEASKAMSTDKRAALGQRLQEKIAKDRLALESAHGEAKITIQERIRQTQAKLAGVQIATSLAEEEREAKAAPGERKLTGAKTKVAEAQAEAIPKEAAAALKKAENAALKSGELKAAHLSNIEKTLEANFAEGITSEDGKTTIRWKSSTGYNQAKMAAINAWVASAGEPAEIRLQKANAAAMITAEAYGAQPKSKSDAAGASTNNPLSK